MMLDPIIVASTEIDGGIEFTLEVPQSLIHFAGHFPGHPILPGVIEVDWAMRLAETHFALPRQRFSQLRSLKFTRPVRPGQRLICRLVWNAEATHLSFTYIGDGIPCASGQLIFAAGEGA